MPAERLKERLLWASFVLALGWRAASPWLQRREVAAGKLEASAFYEFSAFALMGLGFLVAGWIAYRRAPTDAGWAFSMYAALSALHWGGPLGTGATGWFVYFLLSGVLGEALFLHFALIYPEPTSAARGRWAWRLLYGAVGLAALVTVAVLVAGSALHPVGLVLNHTLLPNLFALAAIVLLIVRFARATPEQRSATGLRIAFWAIALGTLPFLAVSIAEAAGVALPGGSQPYNFFFLLIPAGLCAAVIRDHRSRT